MRFALLLPLMLTTGCASFTRGALLSWSCVTDVVDGQVTGSAYYNLDAKGAPIQHGDQWDWRVSDHDLRVALTRVFSEDEIDLFVDVPKKLQKERLVIALTNGREDHPQPDPKLGVRPQWQYNLRLTRAQMQSFASSNEPLYVVVINANGEKIRNVELDPTALARGDAAVELARVRVAEMKQDFRNKCSPMYEANEGIVIT